MGDVVKAEQGQPQQLFAANQMVEIGPGVIVGAGWAGAACVQWCVVVSESGIAEIPAFTAHQGRSMPSEPGWEDTIEQIDPIGHSHGHLAQGADAHQIAGPSIGQQWRHIPHNPVHFLDWFAHAHSADGDSRQVEVGHGSSALTA